MTRTTSRSLERCRCSPRDPGGGGPIRRARRRTTESPLPRCTVTVTIVNRLGLHARPAMAFVDCAAAFRSKVCVRKGETEVDGKSIMQMMMLAATKGSALEITADGDDAEQACSALTALVSEGFGEV